MLVAHRVTDIKDEARTGIYLVLETECFCYTFIT